MNAVDISVIDKAEDKLAKRTCAAFHKVQNARCILEKGHNGKHEAPMASSGPQPGRLSWTG